MRQGKKTALRISAAGLFALLLVLPSLVSTDPLRQDPTARIEPPSRTHPFGTDGFGRSESREALRDHFEVDKRFIVLGALSALAREGQIECDVIKQAMQDLNIDPDKANPTYL